VLSQKSSQDPHQEFISSTVRFKLLCNFQGTSLPTTIVPRSSSIPVVSAAIQDRVRRSPRLHKFWNKLWTTYEFRHLLSKGVRLSLILESDRLVLSLESAGSHCAGKVTVFTEPESVRLSLSRESDWLALRREKCIGSRLVLKKRALSLFSLCVCSDHVCLRSTFELWGCVKNCWLSPSQESSENRFLLASTTSPTSLVTPDPSPRPWLLGCITRQRMFF
jgi:hypothetical protein